MSERVGYIGLGDMGKAMASRLVPAGFATIRREIGVVSQLTARIYQIDDASRR